MKLYREKEGEELYCLKKESIKHGVHVSCECFNVHFHLFGPCLDVRSFPNSYGN